MGLLEARCETRAYPWLVAQPRRISPGAGLNVATAMPCARPVRPAWSEPSPRARSSTSSLSKHGRLPPGPPDLAEGIAHLAHRDVRLRSLDDRGHEVAPVVGSDLLQPRQRRLGGRRVTAGAQGLHSRRLLGLERRIDAMDLDLQLALGLVAVDADDHAFLCLHLALVAERRLGDLRLEEVLLDRGDDAPELLDPVEVVVGLPLELAGQMLHVVGAA